MAWSVLHRHQAFVFFSTFMCVVAVHAAREGWFIVRFTQVKHDVHKELGFSTTFLGGIDTTFLFFYALGYYLSGIVGDRVVISRLIGSGMLGASAFFMILALLCAYQVADGQLFLIIWALQGPCHGTVLTGSVAIMTNWFPPETRGKVMGVWSANQSLGNIVGEYISALSHGRLALAWWWVLVLTGVLMAVVALNMMIFVYDHPKRTLDPSVSKINQSLTHTTSTKVDRQASHHSSISFWKAWSLPGVTCCALCYGGVKLLNYGMMMWLPYYLIANFGMGKESLGLLLSTYDIGGIVGSITGGALSDKCGKRANVVATMILLSAPFMVCFRLVTPETQHLLYVVTPLMGFMVSGAANLISSTVSADLASDPDAKATVIGIINGTGSMGAAVGQIFIGWLQGFSWNAVFGFLVGKHQTAVSVTSFTLLLPLILAKRVPDPVKVAQLKLNEMPLVDKSAY